MSHNDTPPDSAFPSPHPEVWQFPCRYPLKIMGLACDPMRALVCDILSRHAPDFCAETLAEVQSSGGKYVSITVVFTATSKAQIDALYLELRQTPQIRMAL